MKGCRGGSSDVFLTIGIRRCMHGRYQNRYKRQEFQLLSCWLFSCIVYLSPRLLAVLERDETHICQIIAGLAGWTAGAHIDEAADAFCRAGPLMGDGKIHCDVAAEVSAATQL